MGPDPLYRCAFSGCDVHSLTKNEMYRHGVVDHGSFFGAGYPDARSGYREEDK